MVYHSLSQHTIFWHHQVAWLRCHGFKQHGSSSEQASTTTYVDSLPLSA